MHSFTHEPKRLGFLTLECNDSDGAGGCGGCGGGCGGGGCGGGCGGCCCVSQSML